MMEKRERAVQLASDVGAAHRVTIFEFGETLAGGRWHPERWRVAWTTVDATRPPGHPERERVRLSLGLASMLEVGVWLLARGLRTVAIGPALTRAERRARAAAEVAS